MCISLHASVPRRSKRFLVQMHLCRGVEVWIATTLFFTCHPLPPFFAKLVLLAVAGTVTRDVQCPCTQATRILRLSLTYVPNAGPLAPVADLSAELAVCVRPPVSAGQMSPQRPRNHEVAKVLALQSYGDVCRMVLSGEDNGRYR